MVQYMVYYTNTLTKISFCPCRGPDPHRLAKLPNFRLAKSVTKGLNGIDGICCTPRPSLLAKSVVHRGHCYQRWPRCATDSVNAIQSMRSCSKTDIVSVHIVCITQCMYTQQIGFTRRSKTSTMHIMGVYVHLWTCTVMSCYFMSLCVPGCFNQFVISHCQCTTCTGMCLEESRAQSSQANILRISLANVAIAQRFTNDSFVYPSQRRFIFLWFTSCF